MAPMNRNTFHDYVVAHGFGAPTEEGYALAEKMLAKGDDYATASFETVYRGLTRGGEPIGLTTWAELRGHPMPPEPGNLPEDDEGEGGTA